MLFGLAAAPSASVVVVLFSCLLPVAMALAGPLIANTLVARHFVERRGMALGICALGTSVGGLVMPMLVTTLLADFDWRTVMQILGVATLVLIPPAAWLLLPAQAPAGSGIRHSPLAVFRAVNPAILTLALAYLAPLMMFTSVLHNIGAYAVDIGVSQLQAGTAISLMALLMAAAKFGVGALADRVSHSLLYFVMLACVGVAMLLLASGSPFVALNVGVPLLGTAIGGILPLVSAIIAHRFGPERFGAMMGIIMAAAGFSGIAPAGVSLIRDYSGDYNTAFAALLVLLLPAVLCFMAHQRLTAPRLQPTGG
jgi:nitrate/nitrite transporter NarK